MIKDEIAPGILVYSNVIPNSENLYKEIEEGIVSAKIEWQGASVKEADNVTVNTTTRNTLTIGIPYLEKVDTTTSMNYIEEFNKNLIYYIII